VIEIVTVEIINNPLSGYVVLYNGDAMFSVVVYDR